jgi:hypothetical protein
MSGSNAILRQGIGLGRPGRGCLPGLETIQAELEGGEMMRSINGKRSEIAEYALLYREHGL